jgi:5-methylcytosine-specific restriction protein A
MLQGFLVDRGFRDVRDERKFHGKVQSQTLYATTSGGDRLTMWVRLCWRRSTRDPQNATYSGAQILPNVKNNDWEGTLQDKVERERAAGVTHCLLVQREGDRIVYAALVPVLALVEIWCAQRDKYDSLIAQGKLGGRRRRNPATNGASPTIWLQDDQAPEAAAMLWTWSGVQDLTHLAIGGGGIQDLGLDDSFDDLPGLDYSLLGSDGATSVLRQRSYVKRDQRVRAVVIERAGGKCERRQCGAARSYPGFLDVHHIVGVEKSDRVWNCVALCPNCHRETHASPDRDELNTALLSLASRFAPRSTS